MKVTYPADYDGLEMNGTAVIQMLLNGSFNMLQERLGAMTDEEWGQRALPGTSKLGFILWHCARIIDWTVHCAFQGVPEVADRAEWRERFAPEACYGAGIPDALADRVVDSTSRTDVALYLGEVKIEVGEWFARQNDQTLDAVPPMKANQAGRPGYLDPSVWAEVADLNGLPTWQILARPCGAHIRRHMGEYDVLLQALRSRGVVTPRA